MEAGVIYTCISFAPGRSHVPVARDRSLSVTPWLLQKANCFKSRKKEKGKKRGTAHAFTVQHPFVFLQQSKVTQNTAPAWGHYLGVLPEWCRQ